MPLFLFPLWLSLWWAGAELAWLAHRFFVTGGSTRGLWVLQGVGSRVTLPAFLILFAPMLPALSGAMVVGNFAIYLIPAARRAMDLEDRGHPRTDYGSSQRALIKVTWVSLPIAAILALIGAATFTHS